MERKSILIINITILSIIIICVIGAFVSHAVYVNRLKTHYINETNISISFDNNKKVDYQKPTVVLIHTKTCGFCVRFMPIFNKLSKKYKDKYNFVALDANDIRNLAFVKGNITELPMLYIYDTSIGNKIHIPGTMLVDEEHVSFELDRYLHFRGLLNIEQAVKDLEEMLKKHQLAKK